MSDLRSLFANSGVNNISPTPEDFGPDLQNVIDERHRLNKMAATLGNDGLPTFSTEKGESKKRGSLMNLDLTRASERKAKGKWFGKNTRAEELLANLEARFSQSVFAVPVASSMIAEKPFASPEEVSVGEDEAAQIIRQIFARSPLAEEPWCSELDLIERLETNLLANPVVENDPLLLLEETKFEAVVLEEFPVSDGKDVLQCLLAIGIDPLSIQTAPIETQTWNKYSIAGEGLTKINLAATAPLVEALGTQCWYTFVLEGESLTQGEESPSLMRWRAEGTRDAKPRKKQRGRKRKEVAKVR